MRRKNALIIGIANRDSISAAIARELYDNGYNIIPTYLNEKALLHVKEVTDQLVSEGVRLFAEAYDKLLGTIEQARKSVA